MFNTECVGCGKITLETVDLPMCDKCEKFLEDKGDYEVRDPDIYSDFSY